MSQDSLENLLMEYIFPILLAFLLVFLINLLSRRIARRIVGVFGYAPQPIRPDSKRRLTLSDLIASGITFFAFLVAFLFTLGRFMDTTDIIWIIGLFSAAFGLGARPLISDYLTGLGFIFEDTYDIGEKVEILNVQGTIEKINLRTTLLRSQTGELYTIPNGEIRLIRNFSRGKFSSANIIVKVQAKDLNRAITVLEDMAKDAVQLLPNLLEPWQVIAESGTLAENSELTLVAKARFGMAAEMRPRLLALIHERLDAEEIVLAG